MFRNTKKTRLLKKVRKLHMEEAGCELLLCILNEILQDMFF